MPKRLYVIYIPGLGDYPARGQERAVKVWRFYGVKSEIYRMMWLDRRSYQEKFAKLLMRIDEVRAAGSKVSLVAASAGASVALNAFAARKDQISGVVLLCGKVHNPQRMHPSVFRNNLAFGQALDFLPDSLDQLDSEHRQRILSAHPWADESVPVRDTKIDGAVERTLPVFGHFFGIAFGLTIYAPVAIHFLKRQAKRFTN